MKDETKCLHAGYRPKNAEPRVMPIVQSTTYVYESVEEVAAVLLSLLNICNAGDSFISTTEIYGGSVNLFSHTLRRLGIEQGLVHLSVGLENVEDVIADLKQAFFQL